MSPLVVDRLEPVEVAEQHGEAAVEAGVAVGGALQLLGEGGPVRQPGQGIVGREVAHSSLGRLQLGPGFDLVGDVLDRRDHPGGPFAGCPLRGDPQPQPCGRRAAPGVEGGDNRALEAVVQCLAEGVGEGSAMFGSGQLEPLAGDEGPQAGPE
jgi:hypothetical protein